MGERLVIISQDQQLTEEDLTNIGGFAQASLDHVVNDGIESGRKFTGFAVVSSGPAQVTVGAGRMYQGGQVYFRDDEGGVVVDLLSSLPAVTEKIVTIAVWGQTINTDTEPRTFLVDVDTEQTEARAVATEARRFANVNAVNGIESADPVAPALDSNVLAVAYVRLNTAGIVSITAAEDNRLESVRGVSNRTKDLESWRVRAGASIDVISSTVAGIQQTLNGLAPTDLVFEVTRDVARLKELSELPETYTSYDADRYLSTAKSDTANVNYLAAVEEGVKFSPASQNQSIVELLNPIDPLVKRQNNVVLPVYTEVQRDKIVGADSEISIAQYQYQTVTSVQKEISRTRVRYGTTMTVCTNSSWWKSGSYDPVTGIFHRGAESWSVDPSDRALVTKKHQSLRLTQYFVDKYQETYWDVVVTPQAISASFLGETFLNSEPGYVTAVGLYFTRKAATGDLTVMICEADVSGKPDFSKAIARVAFPAANIKIYPEVTKVPLPPTYLEKGKRYAIVPASAGNHFLAAVNGNKNTQGTLFYSTDGAWAQGDLTKDIAYSLYFAKFDSPRSEVVLQALQLGGGIAAVDINFDSLIPDGTTITFEVQVGGVWKALSGDNPDLFIGLPPLLPFRAVLLGTTDVMPGFGVGIRSQTVTSRPRADFKHISTPRVLPAPCDTIEVTLRLEYWAPAHHTNVCKLLTGGTFATVETADSIITEATPDPGAVIRRYTFNVPAPISTYKIQIEGTTDNVLVTYHVAERYDLAFS
ncbi:hypothetical protein ACC862_24225 [Rhizobium ruizarguesonis]